MFSSLPCLLHAVEDVLQLPLLVEHRGGGLPLVRRPHGDQELERPGGRREGLGCEGRRPAQDHDGEVERQQPAVRQAQGLEGQAEEVGGVGLEQHLDRGPHAAAVGEPGQRLSRALGEDKRPSARPKSAQILFERRPGPLLRAAVGPGAEAAEKGVAQGEQLAPAARPAPGRRGRRRRS